MPLSESWQSFAHALIGTPEFTPVQVAQQAGVDLEHARRLWRALGFPPVPDDERVFTGSDVAMLRAVRGMLDDGSTEPDILMQLTRVTGQSLARVAEAQVTATADRLARLRSVGTADATTVDAIGSALKQHFQAIAEMPLPDRLLVLLAELEARERSS